MKLKKGDTVRVISGKDSGKEGIIEAVFPRLDKVVVGGVNIAKRHTQSRGRAGDQGGIKEKAMPIHASNVMLVHKGKTTRIGSAVGKDGSRVRIAKRTGDEI